MALKEPQSVDECVYLTDRDLDKGGYVRAWVLKENCPKCGKALMGKPRDPKTGKPKIRADFYECPACKYTAKKEEYEDTLTVSIRYTCPFCKHQGETHVPFKRKKMKRLNEDTMKKETVDTIRFQCEKCRKDIDITKKMK